MSIKQKPILRIRAQKPCYTYNNGNLSLTVYGKAKLTLWEVNAIVDLAKNDILRKMDV